MSGPSCCVCVGGVNYTIACSSKPCGGCGSCALSMATSKPNASVSQSSGGDSGCGGVGNLSSALNAIGKWGSVITAQAQGKPVSVSAGGVKIGAAGSTNLPGSISSTTLILILIVAAALIFFATRN